MSASFLPDRGLRKGEVPVVAGVASAVLNVALRPRADSVLLGERRRGGQQHRPGHQRRCDSGVRGSGSSAACAGRSTHSPGWRSPRRLSGPCVGCRLGDRRGGRPRPPDWRSRPPRSCCCASFLRSSLTMTRPGCVRAFARCSAAPSARPSGGWRSGTVAVPPPAGQIKAGISAPTFSVLITAYQDADYVADRMASAAEPNETTHTRSSSATTDRPTTSRAHWHRFATRSSSPPGEQRRASARNAAAAVPAVTSWRFSDADDIYRRTRLEPSGDWRPSVLTSEVVDDRCILEVNGRVPDVRTTLRGRFPSTIRGSRYSAGTSSLASPPFGARSCCARAAGTGPSVFAEDWTSGSGSYSTGSRVGCVVEPLARYRVANTAFRPTRWPCSRERSRCWSRRSGITRIRPEEDLVALGTIARSGKALRGPPARGAAHSGGRRFDAARPRSRPERAAPLQTPPQGRRGGGRSDVRRLPSQSSRSPGVRGAGGTNGATHLTTGTAADGPRPGEAGALPVA